MKMYPNGLVERFQNYTLVGSGTHLTLFREDTILWRKDYAKETTSNISEFFLYSVPSISSIIANLGDNGDPVVHSKE